MKIDKNQVPTRKTLEEIGNSITHGVGILIAVLFLILMLKKSDTNLKMFSSIIYGVSMIIMFFSSSIYHAFPAKLGVKKIFRRFDYSSIYLLIGGTYAPILLLLVGGLLGVTIFSIQWLLIIFGITFICVFGPGKFRIIHYTLYFLIGWGGVIFTPILNGDYNGLLLWLILGGALYTLGMIPFMIKKGNCAHFIWHFFVLGGSILQWIGIFNYLY